jgi:hypothetical protein
MSAVRVVDLIVRTRDPRALDSTVRALGAAAVHQDSPDVYTPVGVDLFAVRCFGCAAYVEYAIGKQGYGEVVGRRPVADHP